MVCSPYVFPDLVVEGAVPVSVGVVAVWGTSSDVAPIGVSVGISVGVLVCTVVSVETVSSDGVLVGAGVIVSCFGLG